jgi:hypothetical protein
MSALMSSWCPLTWNERLHLLTLCYHSLFCICHACPSVRCTRQVLQPFVEKRWRHESEYDRVIHFHKGRNIFTLDFGSYFWLPEWKYGRLHCVWLWRVLDCSVTQSKLCSNTDITISTFHFRICSNWIPPTPVHVNVDADSVVSTNDL